MSQIAVYWELIRSGEPEDYVNATQRIYHATGASSYIDLPVVSADDLAKKSLP